MNYLLIIGYSKDGWEMSNSHGVFIILNFLLTLIKNKQVRFIPDQYACITKWFVVQISNEFTFWARKRKDECGISLGFIKFYLARNKEIHVFNRDASSNQ